jgi:hypothetical protein
MLCQSLTSLRVSCFPNFIISFLRYFLLLIWINESFLARWFSLWLFDGRRRCALIVLHIGRRFWSIRLTWFLVTSAAMDGMIARRHGKPPTAIVAWRRRKPLPTVVLNAFKKMSHRFS